MSEQSNWFVMDRQTRSNEPMPVESVWSQGYILYSTKPHECLEIDMSVAIFQVDMHPSSNYSPFGVVIGQSRWLTSWRHAGVGLPIILFCSIWLVWTNYSSADSSMKLHSMDLGLTWSSLARTLSIILSQMSFQIHLASISMTNQGWWSHGQPMSQNALLLWSFRKHQPWKLVILENEEDRHCWRWTNSQFLELAHRYEIYYISS